MSRAHPQPKSPQGRSASAPAPALPAQVRRQHTRLDVRMSAEIRTARSVFTATTRDLSEGGAGLETDRALTEGEEIALGLFLVVDGLESETPPLWVKARVAWTSENDAGLHTAGLRFAVITDEQRAWLRQILTHVHPASEG
jgi:c-di-GMP-binding flagellar brake protein YcgR